MFFVALITYFLIACCVAWLFVFPIGREAALLVWNGALAKFSERTKRLKQSAIEAPWRAWAFRINILQKAKQTLRARYQLFLSAIVMILLPPLAAWIFSGKSMLQGFEDNGHDTNEQVSELLKGEQLAPPAPLPPDFFTTQEVLQIRPMLVTASRNWRLLRPDYAQRLLLAFKIMKESYGYDMAILEGYRSPERQETLARLGAHVTSAAALQSYHQYGLAADCAFLRGGKLVISEKDPWAMQGYRRYGEVAESVGLVWGGKWKMMDFGHTELRLPGILKK